MPEDIPVGAPVSLEFFSTIDSSVLYTHKDHRFTEYINRYYPHIIFFLYESYAIPYIELWLMLDIYTQTGVTHHNQTIIIINNTDDVQWTH